MKFYALKVADDTVRVMQVVRDGIDPNDEIAKWHPDVRARMGVKGFREIAREDIPKGRALREAWVDDGTKIEVDIPKARVLRKKQLEAELGRHLTGPETAELNRKNTAKELEDHKV